ncbi:hypothetical protein TrVE_jg2362 [Triparma verrucosa]|uniref:phenylalanine--tRNA ligase n=2 Tax=Triparma TaxID=722752 RepID=A0A9W7C1B3_9STRA|nr:hypothetical protein TrVE_jg2362 [Triparma verrucosa]GMI00860.1 hypothetical protein TrST_g5044 [Triparma strigata]
MDAIESQILRHLSSSADASLNTYAFSQSLPAEYGVSHAAVLGCAKSLAADSYVITKSNKISYFQLTLEGTNIAKDGSQEAKCWKAIKAAGEAGLDKKGLEAAVGSAVAKVGMGNCMKAKWITKNGDSLVSAVESVTDAVQEQLNLVLAAEEDTNGSVLPAKDFTLLKKRKLVKAVDRTSYDITRGPSYALERKKKAADLTKEMLDSGAWETTEFKPYNFATVGEKVGGGYLHPLLKVRAEFRKILMQMGFEEMPTNKWVESSFWNFDTLFQPQSHPARDAHDTFFIKDPAQTVSVPEEYYKRVVKMHEEGGSGSIGYRYNFKEGDARKNLLRTHTTAVSSQMLYKLANQPGGFTPQRYFSIDRVFRNESMDATHLCEFHQVEGLVADYDLSLGDLIGTIETFFKKIGITQLRFKPAFNPYTEPSMEIFGYHPDLKKWTEIGNSGMFRPEMLAPMGLPPNVRVIAWGLSLERPTMIKYRIKNIRDLFGHKVELARTKTAPVCRFD